ncbi:hypothetical protein [Pseudomonas sp. RC10]|uniref:hypothetical protein n=1 Tax=Pseudomonas bambusae TaxID=3139142 RepID=UPI003138AF82
MNPIAQQALNRALRFPVSIIPPSATPKPQREPAAPTPAPAPVAIPAPAFAIPGKPDAPPRIDRFGFMEGKNYALDAVRSMTALLSRPEGRQEIIQNLKRASAGRPVSQALGIWTVIEAIEAAA